MEIIQCTNVDHKVACMREVAEAVERALFGPTQRNGRKVSIRAGITAPCVCHLDALIWMTASTALNRPQAASKMQEIFMLGKFLTEQGLIR